VVDEFGEAGRQAGRIGTKILVRTVQEEDRRLMELEILVMNDKQDLK
jgi:hypothetical protein